MRGRVVAVYMSKAPCIQLQGSQGASTQLIAPYLDVREDTSHQQMAARMHGTIDI